MCGICGKATTDGKPIERALIERMARIMEHRGPDDEGFHLEQGVGLGFRRLAIIDLSTGHQPMTNEDGSVIIAFNGEVYNFQELRPPLEAAGHQFRTRSDTETIIHAYEEYGLDFVNYLRGMFALAIWDRNQRRLVLARDRLGQKPVFYHHSAEGLVFASEMKSILLDEHVPRDLAPQIIDHYLAFRWTESDHQTVLQHVHRVPPGHLLIYEPDRNHLELKRYWTPSDGLSDTSPTDAEIDALIREAIQLRLISDVPLGAFLSGGLDSSIIVALMAETSGAPVKTFSIGFNEKRFNELPHARLIAERYQTDHTEFVVTPDVINVLPHLVWFLDEPFGDSSALPSYYVAQMARQKVTVALSGDGGDENFSGYRRYKSIMRTLRYMDLPTPLRQLVIEPALNVLPGQRAIKRLRNMAAYARQPLEEQYTHRVVLTQLQERLALYRPDFQAHIHAHAEAYFPQRFSTNSHLSALARILLVELNTVLTNDYLVKVDRMSMANSLEVRSPFLDHKLIEATVNLPDDARMLWRGPGKRILRRLYSPLLPKDLLKKPKAGFSVPIDDWFRGPLRDTVYDVLLSTTTEQRGIFQPQTLRNLVERHTVHGENVGNMLWTLIMLELWLRKFVDTPVATIS